MWIRVTIWKAMFSRLGWWIMKPYLCIFAWFLKFLHKTPRIPNTFYKGIWSPNSLDVAWATHSKELNRKWLQQIIVETAKTKPVISPPWWYMARRTWKFGYWSHGMGIGTPSGPNDPFMYVFYFYYFILYKLC